MDRILSNDHFILKSHSMNAINELGLRLFGNNMIANAQARVWQLATVTAIAAAKHMLFCRTGTTI